MIGKFSFIALRRVPKLMMLNLQFSGRLLMKRASALIAKAMPYPDILPLLSMMKMKWNSEPLPRLMDSGFSSLTTLKES